MKKALKFMCIPTLVLSVAYYVHALQNGMSLSDLTMDNVEALAFCEITKGDNVKLRCDGEGTCSKRYMGYTLTCDGTEVR